MAQICFDLDGTLVNPLPGVQRCVELTCRDLGLPCPDAGATARFIGPGVWGLFSAMPGLDAPDCFRQAMDHYWRHFREEAIPLHALYEGVPAMLARLGSLGHRRHVISAKPTPFAREVLRRFDLETAFDGVFGGSTEVPWTSKTDLIGCLRRDGLLQPGGFLVGDRASDMEAARAHGMRAIGAGYGFGSRGELRQGGAEVVLDSVPALGEWLECALGPHFRLPSRA